MVAVPVEPAGRLLIDFGIKVVDTIGSERGEPGNFCDLPVRPDGLPPSERQCRVYGVNVQVVKGGFRQISTYLGRLHADVDRRYGGILSSSTRARRHDCRQQHAGHHRPSVCIGRHEPPRRGLKKVLRSSTKSSGCSIAAK